MSMTPEEKLQKFIRSIPKVYKPGVNPVLTAFIRAFANSDSEVTQQIQNSKDQMFVRTAEGRSLDRLANSVGVSRPAGLGLDDSTFQELIPNLSLKPKQVRKAFYDTSDVFWGPLFSRSNVQANNFAPYNISIGDEIKVIIDNDEVQTVKVLAGDIAAPGSATSLEMQTILSRIIGATTEIVEDSILNTEAINIRTNTPGPRGAITILTSSMVGSSKLDLPIGKVELFQQPQRVSIYELNPNELIIEIPAVVPALRRTLKGSHHFHEDSTLKGPVAPANEVWQGSFFFDPNGEVQSFSVTGQRTTLDAQVNRNNVYTSIVVDDTSSFENSTGVLVFGWGTEREEQPVRFRGIPNSKTILIDPSYVFQFDHPVGEYVNVIAEQTAFAPSRDGADLPIYMTSPAGARDIVQEILKTLAAAGIIVRFLVLAPDYKYLYDNPYITDDDAPST